MSGFDITYGRAWETDGPLIPGRTAPAPPPVTLPPLIRATRIRLMIERRKATKANPLGSIKAVDFLWPVFEGGHQPQTPPGAIALIKALAAAPGEPEIIVSYARGYDLAATGENVRKPIWEEVVTPPTEEDAGGKKRIKVGEADPVPVDSVTVAGVWRNPSVFVEGWWLDASPAGTRIYDGKGLQALPWTPFMARVKEIIDERGRDDRLL